MDKENKNLLKIVMAIVILMVAGIICYLVYYMVSYHSEANKVAAFILAGNEKLDNGDYEGAIEEYDQALDLDPERQEIKEAISRAYVLMGGTFGTGDDAISAYEHAIVYNSENKSAYWGIANIYEERADEDLVLETLNKGYEATEDANMKIKIDNIEIERARIKEEEEEKAREEAEKAAIEAEHNDLLEKLLPVFISGDQDAIKSALREEAYMEMADEAVGSGICFYYGDKDDSGKKIGKGIGVYQDGYYYYGDFDNDKRQGKGLWIRAFYSDSSALGSFIYEGNWDNDKPNGTGSCTINYYADKVSSSGMTKQVIIGNYKDGLEDGKMVLTGTLKKGGSAKYSYTAENGIAQKSSNEDSGVKGQYIIAKSEDESSNLTSDGSKRGVEGFIN